MPERGSFYIDEGDRLISTDYTRGPWSPELQHGGPPTAALARAMGLALADEDWMLTRWAFDLLRPVPVAPLTITVSTVAQTRSTRRFVARLEVAGKVAIEGRALAMRRVAVDVPPPPAMPSLPAPELCEPFVLPIFRDREGYHRAFEMRRVSGAYGEGPTTTWMRATIDLVAGEAIRPMERVLIVADSCNGLSPLVDPRVVTFVNADLSANVVREMRGEWIAVAAQTALGPEGIGIATGQLFDREGWLGAAAQGLVVRPARSTGGRA